MKHSQLADAVIRVLSDPAPDAPLAELVSLVVDDALDQSLGDLVDTDFLAEQLIAALSSPAPARVATDHLGAAVEQERTRVRENEEKVGDVLPEPVVAEVEARVGRPAGLPPGTWDGVVEPADVRELLAAALADTIQDVLVRLGLGGEGGGRGDRGSGLLGALSRGARAARDTGAGILGGVLGGAFQEGVQRQIRTLAAQSANALKERFRERLQTDEGRAVTARIRHRAAERLLALPLADLYAAADDPGPETVARWGLEILAHNIARPAVRAAIHAQVGAAVERESDRTARSLLDEAGLLPALREELDRRVTARASAVVQTDPFRAWLGALLDRATEEKKSEKKKTKKATKKATTKSTKKKTKKSEGGDE